ncbi:hypothetical protein H4R20_006904 [Coemansia guatemalensis]|uniref:GSKIP domain-containing protein n=1 Tax=Coemansia guatemalensis TaxID=2761395 RepID=A0A9W8HNJ7_9FUNG|nr:hypothetical protein H4R20_006904 [Coemansia guatemalensis]
MPNFRTKDGLLEEFSIELRDNAYGIKSYTTPVVLAEQPPSAESVVVLLSGVKITIKLDTAGYTVRSDIANGSLVDKRAEKAFESLPALLLAQSPEFNHAMHNLLSARLLALQGEGEK